MLPVGRAVARGWRRDRDGDVAALGDALRDAGGAREQALAVFAAPEERHHGVAAGFAGKPVGDEAFQAVADLDPHLPIVHGQHDSAPLSPLRVPMPLPWFSNIFTA